jgi:hypothetical protein
MDNNGIQYDQSMKLYKATTSIQQRLALLLGQQISISVIIKSVNQPSIFTLVRNDGRSDLKLIAVMNMTHHLQRLHNNTNASQV